MMEKWPLPIPRVPELSGGDAEQLAISCQATGTFLLARRQRRRLSQRTNFRQDDPHLAQWQSSAMYSTSLLSIPTHPQARVPV